MSYQKLTNPIAGIDAALSSALAQHAVDAAVHADLLAAGSAVQLETGDQVWLSCVAHDDPATPQVDFITAAIAIKDGAPWVKPNGQVVCSVFWHGVRPQILGELGVNTVRKALLMTALGEPQTQVPIPSPEAGGPVEQDAFPGISRDSRGIRSAIIAAVEVSAPVDDVL